MLVYMAVLALLEWFALCLQCYLTIRLASANGNGPTLGLINFFSYFTILSNLVVALTLSFSRWATRTRAGAFFARATVQSAAAVYITIVGIVYSLALREIWNPQGLQKLADVLLHDLLPVLYVVFWLVHVPKKGLRWTDAFWWLAFPTVYCSYVLVRGSLTGWYPYPFLDAGTLGYADVARNALILLVAFLATGLILVAVAKWLDRRPSRY
jgi:hypothetical protein